MKILTIGGATQDIFIEYNAQTIQMEIDTQESRNFVLLEEGKKIELDAIAYHTGGGATNAAVSFKKLGFDVEAFFKIGNDCQGNYILDQVKKYGVILDNVCFSQNAPTAISVIIPSPSGNKTILVYRGATRELTLDELPWDIMSKVQKLYITSLTSGTASLLLPITEYAKKNKVVVAANPGSSQLRAGAEHPRDALPNIDILILNAFEASLLMKSLAQSTTHPLHCFPEKKENLPALLQPSEPHDLRLVHYFKEVMKNGPRIVVVTNGAEGVYVAHEDQIFFHPSIPVNVVSSVGAGDAFGSTFVGSLFLGKSIEDAIRYGIINAASVIGHVGAKTGLLTLQELKKKLAQVDEGLVQKFTLR